MSEPIVTAPPCTHCGEPSIGIASSGAQAGPGKAVLGFPTCSVCAPVLNRMVVHLVVCTIDDDGRQRVTRFVSDSISIEAGIVESGGEPS